MSRIRPSAVGSNLISLSRTPLHCSIITMGISYVNTMHKNVRMTYNNDMNNLCWRKYLWTRLIHCIMIYYLYVETLVWGKKPLHLGVNNYMQHFENIINFFMPCLFEGYWKISWQVKVTWYCKYVSQMETLSDTTHFSFETWINYEPHACRSILANRFWINWRVSSKE